MTHSFDIFAVVAPGLEQPALAEILNAGFADAKIIPGGVEFTGDWDAVWRANLVLRGPTRILVRIGSFMAFHLAQLDKRARKFPWGDVLRPDVPVRVEVTSSKKSKIYHAGAAQQRIETALRDSHGITIAADAPVSLKVRIDDNRVTFSIDTSGESLHKRGHKEAVGKAPMRENLAALMLYDCGYDGSFPVVDPMCGSGTFVIEAAEITANLNPGRSRSFAFEQLAGFDAERWQFMQGAHGAAPPTAFMHHGSDRDAGAIRMATANAERAGVADMTAFAGNAFSDLVAPDGPKGLVIVNPPYGGRIGQKHMLHGLHAALGKRLLQEFGGWRVAMVTSEPSLAKSSGLPFKKPSAPIPHGGLRVKLFQTNVLP